MSAIDPRRSLALLGPELELLTERIARLTPEELDRPSNLAAWSVADVAVHITRVSDSIDRAIQRAMVADRTPAFGEAARAREAEIRAWGPRGWTEHAQACYRRITEAVSRLTNEVLEGVTFPHPVGERRVRWCWTPLLTEGGLHRWGRGDSLGHRAAV